MAHTFDERLVLDDNTRQAIIYDEHLVRYEFAKQFVKDKYVLDIACGSGYGSKIIAEAGAKKVVAVDVDKETIDFAKKNYFNENIKYITGNAEEIKQDSNLFDVITSFETIEHLQNPDKFLNELARVIKIDGIAIISTPNKNVSHEKNPFHFKEFSRNEFKEIIKKCFNYCHIIEQDNGIVSYIAGGAEQQDKIILNSRSEPIYFIAFCSQEDVVKNLQYSSIASVNSPALNNLLNNIGVRTANKIYSLAIKIPGVKKFLQSR